MRVTLARTDQALYQAKHAGLVRAWSVRARVTRMSSPGRSAARPQDTVSFTACPPARTVLPPASGGCGPRRRVRRPDGLRHHQQELLASVAAEILLTVPPVIRELAVVPDPVQGADFPSTRAARTGARSSPPEVAVAASLTSLKWSRSMRQRLKPRPVRWGPRLLLLISA